MPVPDVHIKDDEGFNIIEIDDEGLMLLGEVLPLQADM